MTRSYEASIDIRARPEDIWSLLTDASGYPAWNPSVDHIEGRIAPDETIKVFVKVNPGRAFPVRVTVFEPPSRMVWSGGMPLGLFTGERTYTLTPNGGETHFDMREEYSGTMLRLIWKSIPDLGLSFKQFAAGLKSGAEGGSR